MQIVTSQQQKAIARLFFAFWVLAAVCIAVFFSAVFSVALAADASLDDSERHFRVDNRHIKIFVNADGTSVTEWYEVTTLLTETGIDWYGEETVTFSTSRQEHPSADTLPQKHLLTPVQPVFAFQHLSYLLRVSNVYPLYH